MELNNCKCGSSDIEAFINPSYYDMFTIRCNNCQKEFDFLTMQMGIDFWNGTSDRLVEQIYQDLGEADGVSLKTYAEIMRYRSDKKMHKFKDAPVEYRRGECEHLATAAAQNNR
jgi:hypothetical protein